MDKVRIGIIGIGNMGSAHAKYISAGEIPNAELTAVCDTNPKRLEGQRNTGGAFYCLKKPKPCLNPGLLTGYNCSPVLSSAGN